MPRNATPAEALEATQAINAEHEVWTRSGRRRDSEAMCLIFECKYLRPLVKEALGDKHLTKNVINEAVFHLCGGPWKKCPKGNLWQFVKNINRDAAVDTAAWAEHLASAQLGSAVWPRMQDVWSSPTTLLLRPKELR